MADQNTRALEAWNTMDTSSIGSLREAFLAGAKWGDSERRKRAAEELLEAGEFQDESVTTPIVSLRRLKAGTEFTAEMFGGCESYRLRVPESGDQFYMVDRDYYIDRASIDPLTVRDVTVPSGTV